MKQKKCEYLKNNICDGINAESFSWKVKITKKIITNNLCEEHTKRVIEGIKLLNSHYEFVKRVEVVGVEL